MTEAITYDLLAYLGELDEQLNDTLDLSEPRTTEDKARLLHATEAVIKTLSAFRGEIAADLYASLESDELIVDGLPPLMRSHGGRRTNWRGGKLAEDVTDKVLEEAADDVPPTRVLAERIRDALVRCGGLDNASHSWRKTEVEKFGLSVNRYCEYKQGNGSVRFL